MMPTTSMGMDTDMGMTTTTSATVVTTSTMDSTTAMDTQTMVTTTDLEEIGVTLTHIADLTSDYNNSAKPLYLKSH